jgi:hypothetical protein
MPALASILFRQNLSACMALVGGWSRIDSQELRVTIAISTTLKTNFILYLYFIIS